MTLTIQDAWSAYGKAVLDQATSGDFNPGSQCFSLAGQTLNVDLGNHDPGVINANVFNIGNTIPAAGGAYTPGSSLISSYFSFLNWIKLQGDPNPNLESQINIAATKMNEAQTNYIAVQGKAVEAWKNYKEIDPNISFQDYTRTQYPIYGEAQNALIGAQSQYEQLMLQAYGPDYQTVVQARAKAGFTNGAQSIMQNTLNMPVKLGSSAPAGSGPAVLPGANPSPPVSSLISTFAPGFTLGGGFTQKYQEWQTASVQQPPVMSGLKVSLDASSTAANWSDFGWSAGMHAAFPVGWFTSVHVSGQASYSEQQFDYASSSFSFDVEYLGSGLFPVDSNLWFDMGIVKNFHNSLRDGHPDFFNDVGGSLARVPAQVLIGFQPKITMHVSASDYESFKSHFQETVNVAYKFGPFTIGHGTESVYSDKSSVKFSDSDHSFSIGPVVSTVPQVIGVISSKILS